MNFNHLFTERELRLAGKKSNCGRCHWLPASEGRATAAKQIHFDMICDTCGCRTTKFMHFREYDIHQKIIKEEVYGV